MFKMITGFIHLDYWNTTLTMHALNSGTVYFAFKTRVENFEKF